MPIIQTRQKLPASNLSFLRSVHFLNYAHKFLAQNIRSSSCRASLSHYFPVSLANNGLLRWRQWSRYARWWLLNWCCGWVLHSDRPIAQAIAIIQLPTHNQNERVYMYNSSRRSKSSAYCYRIFDSITIVRD